ncbi:MAG: hypothetical protein D4R73_07005 [Deltaproteobacteria bacterium]|nr:MAG: hypothetical protein D4R73_07005 [Deltaproteobacteria bacterium]
MKITVAVKKLDAHIAALGMSRCGWAKKHGYPLPVVTRFLKGERGVSFCTVAKFIEDSGGALCWDDFLQPSETRGPVIEDLGAPCVESAS